MTNPDGRTSPHLVRLLDALPFPAALVDQAGRCLYRNAALRRHAPDEHPAVEWVEAPPTVEVPRPACADELLQEIRSPLAAIVGLADALARSAPPERTRTADLIRTSTQHLIRRLDQTLQTARAASGTDVRGTSAGRPPQG